jgi:hypothetical protein
MRLAYWFARMAGLALVSVSLFMPAMNAQTVISNESLVSTTFVVNKTNSTSACSGGGCIAKPVPMFKPIQVTCPAAIGKTCTLNITLDAKTYINGCTSGCNGGDEGRYQFLVDGEAPMPGPTDRQGFYIFSIYGAAFYNTRVSYPASVVGRVTNSRSKDHKIEVNVSCTDASQLSYCEATAHWSTMRIDVFEP